MSIDDVKQGGWVEKQPGSKPEIDRALAKIRARQQERTNKIGRVGSFLDQQASAFEEVLLGDGRDLAVENVAKWMKEKKKSYKDVTQGGPVDPELSAITLMSGLEAERNREDSLDQNMDAGIAKEAADKAKFAEKIFDQEMILQNALSTKIDTKDPNSLNEIVAQTKEAQSMLLEFGGMGWNVVLLQERLRELQQGKASSKDVLNTVNEIFHDLDYSGHFFVGTIVKLADPKTTSAERAALLKGIEQMNKTISALQAVRKQLEATVYEKGAAEPAARSKINALREAITERLAVTEQSRETPSLSPEELVADSWMKGLTEAESAALVQNEARGSFFARQYTPLFEALTSSTGSSEKTRQTILSWMSAIQASVDKFKKAGKTDYEAESEAVKDFVASKPIHLASTFTGGRTIEDTRFSKFPSNDFKKIRFNPTDEYTLSNLFSNFRKNKNRK